MVRARRSLRRRQLGALWDQDHLFDLGVRLAILDVNTTQNGPRVVRMAPEGLVEALRANHHDARLDRSHGSVARHAVLVVVVEVDGGVGGGCRLIVPVEREGLLDLAGAIGLVVLVVRHQRRLVRGYLGGRAVKVKDLGFRFVVRAALGHLAIRVGQLAEERHIRLVDSVRIGFRLFLVHMHTDVETRRLGEGRLMRCFGSNGRRAADDSDDAPSKAGKEHPEIKKFDVSE